MPKPLPVLPSSEPDPATVDRMATVNRACLFLIGVIAIGCLAFRLTPSLNPHAGGMPFMKAESALAAFLGALSLGLAEAHLRRRWHWISRGLAAILGLFAASVLIDFRFHTPFTVLALIPGILRASGTTAPLNAAAFALLALTILLIRAQGRYTAAAADLFAFLYSLMFLVLGSGYVFATSPLFGKPSRYTTSPELLLCLLLFAVVLLLHRAQIGVFSIFLSRGLGANISRILSPVLIILPFARETLRARFFNAGRMPPHYITAVLATVAVGLSLSLLLYLAWRIHAMETEIRALSLRDELTGLHNLRGFRLLAEQALRLAQRSGLPFSVLFIDVDNLKEINDTLGHPAGSAFLIETAEILRAAFRETDVLGRVGGDEFAVAGQFDHRAIAQAAARLSKFALDRNAVARDPLLLTFSVGYVTTDHDRWDSLDVLLAKADQMMYNEKRGKKFVPASRAPSSF